MPAETIASDFADSSLDSVFFTGLLAFTNPSPDTAHLSIDRGGSSSIYTVTGPGILSASVAGSVTGGSITVSARIKLAGNLFFTIINSDTVFDVSFSGLALPGGGSTLIFETDWNSGLNPDAHALLPSVSWDAPPPPLPTLGLTMPPRVIALHHENVACERKIRLGM